MIICYEYVETLEKAAPDVTLRIGGLPFTKEDALVGAFVHVGAARDGARGVRHSGDSGLGTRGHAADRVAGYIMFQFGEKVAYRTLVGTSWFLAQTGVAVSGLPGGDFSYVRGVQGETLQRFYNTLCIALGGDPARSRSSRRRCRRDAPRAADGNTCSSNARSPTPSCRMWIGSCSRRCRRRTGSRRNGDDAVIRNAPGAAIRPTGNKGTS